MVAWLPLCLSLVAPPPAELRFEAEACSQPVDAWLADQDTADHWDLWSQDSDAEKKWSGGVVLRAPVAVEDRARPEEGAPALHVTLTGLPAATWEVSLSRPVRVLGISLDGRTWRPYRGGPLGVFPVRDGRLELWVDDKYANPDRPGYCYFDYIQLRLVVPVADGVVDPGYETEVAAGLAGWVWWSRGGGGEAVAVTDRVHSGARAVRLRHDGEADFAFTCAERTAVAPGQRWRLSGWLLAPERAKVQLAAVGLGGGQVVTWSAGVAASDGGPDWRELNQVFTVPAGVDAVYLRWVGSGRADVVVDDVRLVRVEGDHG